MEYNQSDVSSAVLNNYTQPGKSAPPFISDENLKIVQIVNHLILSGIVCFLGIIGNILNMIVFYTQGLNSTINISFFAMAISDLASLVTLEWLNFNLNPFMESTELPYEPSEVQYLTGGWPHACFARITCCITVYVTAERCVCVIYPLKVKQIITPKRTKIAICAIYLLMILVLSPEYISYYFGDKWNPVKNKTLVGLVTREYSATIESFSFLISAIASFISFSLVALFTLLLVYKLKERTKWRSSSLFDRKQSDNLSTRDQKTINTVLVISITLIICFSPGICTCMTVLFVPEFALTGKYANLFHTAWSIVFLCEAINCSISIVLYYIMSSKYKETFHQLFAKCRRKKGPASTGETSKTVTASTGETSKTVTENGNGTVSCISDQVKQEVTDN